MAKKERNDFRINSTIVYGVHRILDRLAYLEQKSSGPARPGPAMIEAREANLVIDALFKTKSERDEAREMIAAYRSAVKFPVG